MTGKCAVLLLDFDHCNKSVISYDCNDTSIPQLLHKKATVAATLASKSFSSTRIFRCNAVRIADTTLNPCPSSSMNLLRNLFTVILFKPRQKSYSSYEMFKSVSSWTRFNIIQVPNLGTFRTTRAPSTGSEAPILPAK